MKRKLLPITILALLGVSALAGCNNSGGGSEKIVDVTGVSLNKTTVSLVKDSTETLVATVEPADATNSNVTWKSANSRIATVDETGKVTAVDVGETEVTVTTVDGGYTAKCTVSVTLAINSLTISNKAKFAPDYEGEDKIVLEADGLPGELKLATDPADINISVMSSKGYLHITSSDKTVATIRGLNIYPQAAGTTRITAELFGKSDSFELTVIAARSNKELYQTEHEGDEADPFTNEDALKVAKALETKGWENNRMFYFKGEVDSFANAPGSGVSGDNNLIAWYMKPATEGGAKFEAYKVEIYENDVKRAWTDADIWVGATVTFKSKVLTVYKGTYETSFAECVKIEGDRPALTGINVPTSLTVDLSGEGSKISVKAEPFNAYLDPTTLNFESANDQIATVDSNGLVTAVARGETTITVTCGDLEAKTVNVKVVNINYGTKDNPIAPEEAVQLIVDLGLANNKLTEKELFVRGVVSKILNDSYGHKVFWLESTDKATEECFEGYQVDFATGVDSSKFIVGATVTLQGFAKKYNTTYEITSYKDANNNYVYPHIVEIIPAPEEELTGLAVTPASVNLEVDGKQQLTVAPVPAAAVLGEVTYTSNDTAVATVSATGEVTAVAAGNTTITVACGTVSKDVTVTVVSSINYGTLEDPISPEDAVALVDTVAVGEKTAEEVTVRGTVSKILNDSYGHKVFWLQSSGETPTEEYLQCWQCGFADGVQASKLQVGAVAIVKGYAMNYNSQKYEITSYKDANNQYVYPQILSLDFTAPALETITVTANKTEVNLNGKTEAQTVQMTATKDPVTAEGEPTWTTDNANVTVSATGLVSIPTDLVAEDATPVTVKVTATIGDKHGECTITVKNTAEGGGAVETTVEFVQSELTGDSPISKNGVTLTNTSSYTGTVTELRIYKSSKLTVSVESGKLIKSIVMTCTANGTTKQGPGCFGNGAPNGYTFEANGPTGTWTGSLQSVEFTASDNQVRITSLVVIYE